jgi:hypothetical protein
MSGIMTSIAGQGLKAWENLLMAEVGETIATQIAMKTDAHQAVLQAQRQMAWIQTPRSMSY